MAEADIRYSYKITEWSENFVHRDVRSIDRYAGQLLERKADAYLVGLGDEGKKPIVVTAATAETMAHPVEAHAWNHCHIDSAQAGEGCTHWLHDVEEAAEQAFGAFVVAQLHFGVADDSWQQYRLSIFNQPVKRIVGVHFVGQ